MPSLPPRFLTLADVADVLNVTVRQVYALVRSGDLRGIQIGGRGQWRIEAVELEGHPFYLGTLFQPQMTSLDGGPVHPLVLAFLEAASG